MFTGHIFSRRPLAAMSTACASSSSFLRNNHENLDHVESAKERWHNRFSGPASSASGSSSKSKSERTGSNGSGIGILPWRWQQQRIVRCELPETIRQIQSKDAGAFSPLGSQPRKEYINVEKGQKRMNMPKVVKGKRAAEKPLEHQENLIVKKVQWPDKIEKKKEVIEQKIGIKPEVVKQQQQKQQQQKQQQKQQNDNWSQGAEEEVQDVNHQYVPVYNDVYQGKMFPVFSSDQVSELGEDEDCIVSHGDGVYDVTEFISMHPGRNYILMARGGALEPFWATYRCHLTKKTLRLLEEFRIGVLAEQDRVRYDTPEVENPYQLEPARDQQLKVLRWRPFDAYTPLHALADRLIVPARMFYIRNHFPVPNINENNYTVRINLPGKLGQTIRATTSLEHLKSLPHHEVLMYMKCAGNRAKSLTRDHRDADGGQMGNATFQGCKLRDVLLSLGLDEDLLFTRFEEWHVHLQGADGFSLSIPLELAVRIDRDVLLAWDMNGKPLMRDHGFPLRVVVPGCVGARSVKWISSIDVRPRESDSPWQHIYRCWDKTVQESHGVPEEDEAAHPCMEWPLNSVILWPAEGDQIAFDDEGDFTVHGVGLPSGGRSIIKLEVTCDGGKSWKRAELPFSKRQRPWGRDWSWSPWTVVFTRRDFGLPPNTVGGGGKVEAVLSCRAVDNAYQSQPEYSDETWNMRGYMVNERHRVNIVVDGDQRENKSWRDLKKEDIKKTVQQIEEKPKNIKSPMSSQKNTIKFGVDQTATMKHINES